MKICFAIPIFVILSLKICELNAAVLNEQFDSFPNYFNIENGNAAGTNTVLSTNVSDGILSFLTDGLSQDIEIELHYPVSSADTQTGILYFTVEAGNSALVTDGGTFIDEDGDIEAINQAVAWLAFSSFSGDDEVALRNHNGQKSITFGDDNYIEVNEFDKVYLRLSYDFNTSITKQYYSIDGSNFIELHSSFAPNDNFSITLGAESNYATFNQGDVYFDNFVISADTNYDSTFEFYKIAEFNFNNGSLADSALGSNQNNKFLPRKDLFFIDTIDSENENGSWINFLNELALQEFGFDVGTYEDDYFTLCRKLPSDYDHVQFLDNLLNENSLIKSSEWDNSSVITDTITNNNYNYVESVWGLSGLYGFRNSLVDGYNNTYTEGYGITDGKIKISYKIKNWNFSNGLSGVFERSPNSNSEVSFSITLLSGNRQWIGGLLVLATDTHTIILGHGYDPNKYGYGLKTPGSSTLNKRIGGLYGEFEESLAVELTIDLDLSTYTFSCGDYTYTANALHPLTDLTVESIRVNAQHFDFFNFITLDDITISATNPKDSDEDGISDMVEENNSYANNQKTDRFNRDTDGDLLDDRYELSVTGTDPTLKDSNGDGFDDGIIYNNNMDLSNDYSVLADHTISKIAELNLDSHIIQVIDNQATVQLQMEESSDLQTWEDKGDPATMTIQADTDTKFFRFKIAE